jgi:hypothetical protein
MQGPRYGLDAESEKGQVCSKSVSPLDSVASSSGYSRIVLDSWPLADDSSCADMAEYQALSR